jgi:hypothetical protein
MKKAISIATTISFRNWGEFFSSPIISGLAQSNPITASISAFVSSTYQQQQYQTMQDFLEMLNSRTKNIKDNAIDKEFFSSSDGKRILGKALRSIIRDNRKEKLIAMANLTANLFLDKKISVDEKELYVDILDILNSLQLSILGKAVRNIKAKAIANPTGADRGFGWELLAEEYGQKGVSQEFLLQSIRVLESNGLINENTAQISHPTSTHFVTNFGEQFYDYVSEELLENINT